MKITILKEKLKEGISIVERISSKSLNLPILNNILITTEKNFVNLSATDLEIGIKWWSLVKTEREGKITIPSRILSNLVNFLPNKPINLEIKDLNLVINCENYQTLLKGVNPEDFPIIPQISTTEKISVNSKNFCQNLNQIVDIANYSSSKPEISGVFLSFQKNLVIMAATDSFRLGEKKLTLNPEDINISQGYSLIIPQRTAKEIINIFGEKENNLNIYFSPNQVLFEILMPETHHPQIHLISRLIEGEYPNYQEIIPKKYETSVFFLKDEIINHIKSASLFSGKINEIKLKIDPKKNQVDFYSQSPDIGEYHSFLNVKVEGKPCEISFNYRFLLDGLLSIVSKEKKPEVVLELINSEKPGVLRLKGDDSYLYLVMPIKST